MSGFGGGAMARNDPRLLQLVGELSKILDKNTSMLEAVEVQLKHAKEERRELKKNLTYKRR
jgi:hypothetical protein